MSLTPEQLAAENAFFDGMHKAYESCDAAAAFAHFNEEATLTDEFGHREGVSAIRAYFETMWTLVETCALRVNARTFDPAQNLVWEAIETTITLKADPEKKEIRFQALYMTKKVLGSGAAKIDSIQRFAGLKEFSTRMEELGLPIVM